MEETKPSPNPKTGYEPSDLRPQAITAFAAVLAVILGAVFLVSYWMYRQYRSDQAKEPAAASSLVSRVEIFPEPRLQVHAPQDLKELRAAEEATLNSFGWVDQNAGIARIPIDQAMKLLAERGLPVREKATRRSK